MENRDLVYKARPNALNWVAAILVWVYRIPTCAGELIARGLGPWLYGYDSGIISSVVSPEYDQFEDYFHPTSAMTGTVVAIIYAGAVCER